MLKRYACHITAHNPVEATLDLRNEHKFTAADVASIDIAGNDRMATTNNIPAPGDMMLAQYCIPFSVALSLYRNPVDPRSFDEAAVHDRAILDMSSRIKMPVAPGQDRRDLDRHRHHQAQGRARVLAQGRELQGHAGAPARSQPELKEKFMMLTQRLDRGTTEALFDRLQPSKTRRRSTGSMCELATCEHAMCERATRSVSAAHRASPITSVSNNVREKHMTRSRKQRRAAAPAVGIAAASLLAILASDAQARVTRIVIEKKVSPAFDGASFGTAGQYETLAGRAFGELDPNDPHNARHPGHQARAAQCARHGRIHGDVPAREAGGHVARRAA